jgi:hypothetical protein
MQKVVDSNFLQREQLRQFLAASPRNKAVLTDYVAFEAHKGDTLQSIYKSMEILCEFPRQIVILKGTGVARGLSGRAAGLQRRLVDQAQTHHFPEYCRDLQAAKAGDLAIQQEILKHGRVATAQMARVQADVGSMSDVFSDMAKAFTNDEISVLRRTAPFTEPILDKMIKNVMMLAAIFMKNHPRVYRIPNARELPNTFLFRFSLCGYLLLLDWISQGSQPIIKSEKLRNDLVDTNFAAFATYFDGLLSQDKKLCCIHSRAEYIRHEIAAFHSQY